MYLAHHDLGNIDSVFLLLSLAALLSVPDNA